MMRYAEELSESLAMLEALERMESELEVGHVVDLCCGKSLTAALVALRRPSLRVTAIDRVPPLQLPHYTEAGVGSVSYLQLDVLSDGFQAALAGRLAEVGEPAVILGMHLCGRLSEVAADAFRSLGLVRGCALAPCCLPRADEAPPSMSGVYGAGAAEAEQHEAWWRHLEACLRAPAPGGGPAGAASVEVSRRREAEILSPRRTVISAWKRRRGAGAAP